MSEAAAVVYANSDWLVGTEGLEHRHNGYFIAREDVSRRRADGVWLWPLHMAEKLWCAPATFAEAFMAALRAYRVQADGGLALAFTEIGGIEAAEERLLPVPDLRAPGSAALPSASTPPRPEDTRLASGRPWRRQPMPEWSPRFLEAAE